MRVLELWQKHFQHKFSVASHQLTRLEFMFCISACAARSLFKSKESKAMKIMVETVRN